MFIQLKNKTGMFYDPETKFRLRGDEVREVKHVGYQTRLRMNSGGIVMVDAPVVKELPVVIEQVVIEDKPVAIEEVVIEPIIEEVQPPKPKAKRKPGSKKKKTTFSLE